MGGEFALVGDGEGGPAAPVTVGLSYSACSALVSDEYSKIKNELRMTVYE